MDYRKIWEQNFGPIPKDENGRTFEIHHKDGNRNNNNLDNLLCLSIEEHYKIHYLQGDWAACVFIAQRMRYPPNHLSDLQRGKKRPGIGGVPKGTVPWNKGIRGYGIHSEEYKKEMSERMKKDNPSKKLTEEDKKEIINLYNKKEYISGVGLKTRNGKILNYETAFSKKIAPLYNVVPGTITAIIKKNLN